jgi:signal transduction histidine kinase
VASSLTAEQSEYLERLELNSYWIAQLVEDMLFLARLGQVQEEIEPIALGTLVRGIVTHLELERQGIAVTIQPDMPTLYADPVLLWVYFRNVLQNACRLFQGVTDPQIQVGYALSPEEYQLSVQTNGQTLTPEQLQRAYELFFPVGEPEEVGIGLAIARRIGEHYGGSVWAAAAADGGTTLNLILPRQLGINREDQQ